MVEVKNDIQDSILKLNNYYRIEEIHEELLEYKYNRDNYGPAEQILISKRLPALKLFEQIHSKQLEVLISAERRVKDLLNLLDPNREPKIERKHLFQVNKNLEFDRIIQRLIITLQKRKLIDVKFGGNAENFRLLFDYYNPDLKNPERIKWYGSYEELSFLIYTLHDIHFIEEKSNTPLNHYVKAGRWFCNKDGNTFKESSDPKKRRFTGRPESYSEFSKAINWDFQASIQKDN